MKDLNVVSPQYYEWHTEMEQIVKITGREITPDELLQLFEKIHIRLSDRLAASPPIEIACALCVSATHAFAQNEEEYFGTVAYINAMRNSHDRETQNVGERIMIELLGTFINSAVLRKKDENRKKP